MFLSGSPALSLSNLRLKLLSVREVLLPGQQSKVPEGWNVPVSGMLWFLMPGWPSFVQRLQRVEGIADHFQLNIRKNVPAILMVPWWKRLPRKWLALLWRF